MQLAGALHINQARSSDQDVGDGGIAQQRLERAQAEDFVENFLDDAVLFHQAEGSFLFLHQPGDGRADFCARSLACHGRQGFQIDAVQ